LQEYADHWHEALQAALKADYPYASFLPRQDSFGMAIYSRTPFVGAVNQWLPLGREELPQMRTVIRLAGREVGVYNIHLLPPRRLAWISTENHSPK